MDILFDIVPDIYFISFFFPGGMNHYKQDHPLYNVQGHANLFVKDADNVMFNQFTAYILSEFPKMQNMKSFAVHEQTDIDEFFRESRILPYGTDVYRFFKELMAYLRLLSLSRPTTG